MKLEFLEITGKFRHRERLVMISSVIPSTKNSCSESPLIFAKGKTAIAGGLFEFVLSSDTDFEIGSIISGPLLDSVFSNSVSSILKVGIGF